MIGSMGNWNECDSIGALCTVVGTGELSSTTCGGIPCDSLVQPISMFCATGDHWDGEAVSVKSDRVRHDNSTQSA